MTRQFGSLFALGSALLLLACSSSDDDAPMSTPTAQLRVVHASPDAPAVDVFANGSSVVRNAPFKAATAFQSVAAGRVDLRVNVAGTTTTALSASPTLEAGKFYTVMAVNQVASLEPLVIQEDGMAPASGSLKVRVVHAAPKAPSVDVYVTTATAVLDTTTPTLSNVPFKGVSNALEIPAATYRVRLTAAGSKDPVYDSGPVPLAAGSNLVLAAVEQTLGASPVTLLGLTRNPSAPTLEVGDYRALIRAMHASPDAPAVDILVNNQVALNNVPYPINSAYLPLPNGTTNLKVNVAGTSTIVLQATPDLAAGRIYTAVAIGTLSAVPSNPLTLKLITDK